MPKKEYQGPLVKQSQSHTHAVLEDYGRMLFIHKSDINGLIHRLRKLYENEKALTAELP